MLTVFANIANHAARASALKHQWRKGLIYGIDALCPGRVWLFYTVARCSLPDILFSRTEYNA